MSEKLFGYIRVSSVGQADKDGPLRQRSAISDFSLTNKVPVEDFFSEAISGTVDGLSRPEFARMLLEAEGRGITGIVIERMDRLARDLIVSEMLIQEIKKRGLKLYAADQGPVDQITADGDPSRKLIRQIFSALAEWEKSALVMKLRAARERKKRTVPGWREGRKPYGKTPAEKTTVNLIASLRQSGQTWRQISDALTEGQIKKRCGTHVWCFSEVRRIYRNATRRPGENREGSITADARTLFPCGGANGE